MSSAKRAVFAAAMGMATTVGASCTDTELKCVSQECQVKQLAVVDNIVQAQGKVCTRDPNSSSYPYKIILVVDTSGSTVVSDPTAINGRWKAVQKVLTDPNYLNNPQIQFAVIRFATDPIVLQPTFTADRQVLQASIASLNDAHNLGGAAQGAYQDYQTDYLKALKAVEKVITDDANAADAGERAYTQYDVQWLSDGNPEVNPDPASADPTDPTLIAHCAEDIPTVIAETQNLANLATTLGVFSVSFSAIFLDAQPPFVSACSVYYNTPTRWGPGPSYLMPMVNLFTPKGTYQELSADKLAFDIHVNSINRRFEQNSFFLVNYSRVIEGNQLLPDSDQDGIADADESAAGLDPLKGRSLSTTLCSDLARYRSSDNPTLCIQACSTTNQSSLAGPDPLLDKDSDTLLNCEEKALLSDPSLVDSDSDNLTDDIETRFDSSPISFTDNRLDNDRDGVYDYDEIILGLNPKSPQPDRSLAYSYAPLATDTGDANAGVTCYSFQVDNVRLAATLASDISAKGENQICALLVQHPVNNPNGQPTVSRACKTANFQLDPNGLGIKEPADGILQFAESDFQLIMCGGAPCQNANTATGSSASSSSNSAQPTNTTGQSLGTSREVEGRQQGAPTSSPSSSGGASVERAVLPGRDDGEAGSATEK